VVDAVTAVVLTVKGALVARLQPSRWKVRVAAVVLLLESVTVAPPAGAGPQALLCRSRNSRP